MKKLIWKYLDLKYPHAYRKRTKFGLCGSCFDEAFSFVRVSEDISHMFCYERKDAFEVLKDWFDTKPVMDNIPNSTNPDVLENVSSESLTNTILNYDQFRKI